jgi:hypothetical protein
MSHPLALDPALKNITLFSLQTQLATIGIFASIDIFSSKSVSEPTMAVSLLFKRLLQPVFAKPNTLP